MKLRKKLLDLKRQFDYSNSINASKIVVFFRPRGKLSFLMHTNMHFIQTPDLKIATLFFLFKIVFFHGFKYYLPIFRLANFNVKLQIFCKAIPSFIFCYKPCDAASECEDFAGVWHGGPGSVKQRKKVFFWKPAPVRRKFRSAARRGWCAHALCRSPLPLHKAHHYHQQVHIVAALFEDLLSAAQREGPRPFLCNPQHFTHSLSPPPKSPPIYFLFLGSGVYMFGHFYMSDVRVKYFPHSSKERERKNLPLRRRRSCDFFIFERAHGRVRWKEKEKKCDDAAADDSLLLEEDVNLRRRRCEVSDMRNQASIQMIC